MVSFPCAGGGPASSRSTRGWHRGVLLVTLWLLALAAMANEDVSAVGERLPAGGLDSACASDCGERGYEVAYCARACWVPEPVGPTEEVVTDGVCLASCRERGGLFASCWRACRRD